LQETPKLLFQLFQLMNLHLSTIELETGLKAGNRDLFLD